MNRLVVLLPVLVAILVGAAPATAWTWPADGPVLQHFVLGGDPYAAGQHRGIDIAAAGGTPVRAPARGVVTFAGAVPRGGRTVTIETADGYAVTLLHLGSTSVARGAAVQEGDVVAIAGTSGDPEHSRPYVHLGIRLAADPNGYVDPLAFLPPRAPAAGVDGAGGADPAPPAGAEVAGGAGDAAPDVTGPAQPPHHGGAQDDASAGDAGALQPSVTSENTGTVAAAALGGGPADAATAQPEPASASTAAPLDVPAPPTTVTSLPPVPPAAAGAAPAPTVSGTEGESRPSGTAASDPRPHGAVATSEAVGAASLAAAARPGGRSQRAGRTTSEPAEATATAARRDRATRGGAAERGRLHGRGRPMRVAHAGHGDGTGGEALTPVALAVPSSPAAPEARSAPDGGPSAAVLLAVAAGIAAVAVVVLRRRPGSGPRRASAACPSPPPTCPRDAPRTTPRAGDPLDPIVTPRLATLDDLARAA